MTRILVLGAGNFGSCLADHLASPTPSSEAGFPPLEIDENSEVPEVFIWARSSEVVKTFNEEHRNPKYLAHHAFAESIRAVGPELPERDWLKTIDVFIWAIPTQGLRKILQDIHPKLDNEEGTRPLFIFVNKGIETGTLALSLEIVADTCGKEVAREACFISGPSFAKEIVKRLPTTVSVASLSIPHAEKAALLFHQPWFRCYTGGDPIGVELAGALKNVYAIASGIAEGLGYENNTRAGLITRSLSEMTRIGYAYGASPLTFLSLAGVGDLFLTCSSRTSRNYTVGLRLGQGETLEKIIETLGSVAEGVTTAKGAKEIIDRLGLRAPIVEGVYGVLYEGKSAQDMAQWLMGQPAVPELDLPAKTEGPVHDLLVKLGMV